MLRTLLLASLASIQTQSQHRIPDDPARIVRTVERAFSENGVERLAATLERDRKNRNASLGLGAIQLFQYNYDSAQTVLSALTRNGPADRIAAWANYLIAGMNFDRSRIKQAVPAAEAALGMARRLGDSTLEVLTQLQFAARRLRETGVYQALALVDSLEPLIPPENKTLAGEYLCYRGRLHGFSGNRKATPEIHRGLHILQEEGYVQGQARCAASMATVFSQRGLLDSSSYWWDRSADLFREARDTRQLAAVLQWSGWEAWDNGASRRGQDYLLEARALAEETEFDLVWGWATVDLASVALSFHDYPTAARYLHEAETALARAGDSLGVRTTRWQRADLLTATGAYTAAESRLKPLMAWADNAGFSSWSLGIRGNLFELYTARGEFNKAEQMIDQARQLIRKHNLSGWNTYYSEREGYLALRRGDMKRAGRLLDGVATVLSTEGADNYRVQAFRAEVALREDRIDTALKLLTRATDDLERFRATLSGSALQRFAFQQDRQLAALRSVATVIGSIATHEHVELAFSLVERHRARELRDMMIRSEASRSDSVTGTGDISPPRDVLRRLQRALPAGAALIEYMVGPQDAPTTAFLITQDSAIAVVMEPLDPLTPVIGDLLAAIESGDTPDGAALQLGNAFLAPVLARAPGEIRTLIVVPDGALHRVPFEMLRLRRRGYAIGSFEFTYMPSASSTVQILERHQRTGPTRLLAMGDPAFEQVPTGITAAGFHSTFTRAGALTRLRGSRHEAKRVGRYARDHTTLLGADASEAFLKNADLSQYSIIHLATHALVDEGSVRRTAIALAPGDGEDGFLAADELAELHLTSDLVFLSGCSTTGGRLVTGEGLLGLTSPLLAAGSRSVIGTQWAVDDRLIQNQVFKVYDRLAAGESVAEALRQTKLELIEKGAKPREWAVLAVIGNPRVRVKLTRPRWWRIW